MFTVKFNELSVGQKFYFNGDAMIVVKNKSGWNAETITGETKFCFGSSTPVKIKG